MSNDGREWNVNHLLFADDTALMTFFLQVWLKYLIEESGRVCARRKLRVNESMSKVMKFTKTVDDRKMNVAPNGKWFEEVECFMYLRLHIAIDRVVDDEVKHRMNEVGKVCRGMKKK